MGSKKKKSVPSSEGAGIDSASAFTLADLAREYIAHLDRTGKSAGTLFSYKMELESAIAEIGATAALVELTPERVVAFNESERVLKTKTGRPKSKLTIDKTRRVLRLALVWAAEKDWISEAPIPQLANAAIQ